jgi:hypothetical protein
MGRKADHRPQTPAVMSVHDKTEGAHDNDREAGCDEVVDELFFVSTHMLHEIRGYESDCLQL